MKKFKILCLVILGLTSTSTFAEQASDQLIASLKKIDTFQAQFNQKIRDANGENISNSKGKVVIRRPGQFYWKSQSPDPMLVIADGKFLWTYDIDLAQVTKQTQKDTIKNSPAALLAGKVSDLTTQFNIGTADKCDAKTDQCYTLSPKQKDATFSNILIGFAKDKLIEIKMHDTMGQEVHTLFSTIEMNKPVNMKLFSFQPPKGVDIIQSGT